MEDQTKRKKGFRKNHDRKGTKDGETEEKGLGSNMSPTWTEIQVIKRKKGASGEEENKEEEGGTKGKGKQLTADHHEEALGKRPSLVLL